MDTRVREYALLECLGKGGMGEVYKASNVLVREDLVAIKVIRPELTGNPELRSRFLREAAMLLKLEHPNILKYRHVFEEGGRLYLVSEFLAGRSLDRVLRSGKRIGVQEGMVWLQQIVSGVSYAHGKGVIHRDLKPENILLVGDGSVRILDFGLAKQLGHGSGAVTAATQILGTPPYLPPEVVTGDVGVKDIGAEADSYAMGVIAYRMFAGKLPYGVDESESSLKLLSKLAALHAAKASIEPLDRVRADLPQEFCAAVMSALERNPSDRPKNVNDLFFDVIGNALCAVRLKKTTRLTRLPLVGNLGVNPLRMPRLPGAEVRAPNHPSPESPNVQAGVKNSPPGKAPRLEVRAPPLVACPAEPASAGQKVHGQHTTLLEIIPSGRAAGPDHTKIAPYNPKHEPLPQPVPDVHTASTVDLSAGRGAREASNSITDDHESAGHSAVTKLAPYNPDFKPLAEPVPDVHTKSTLDTALPREIAEKGPSEKGDGTTGIRVDEGEIDAESRTKSKRDAVTRLDIDPGQPPLDHVGVHAAAIGDDERDSDVMSQWLHGTSSDGAGQDRKRINWAVTVLATAAVIGTVAAVVFVLEPRSRISAPGTSPETPAAPGPAVELGRLRLGTLIVETDPPGAEILINGSKFPKLAPARLPDVAAGIEHAIVVEKAGFVSVNTRVQVEEGETRTVRLALLQPKADTTSELAPGRTEAASAGDSFGAVPAEPTEKPKRPTRAQSPAEAKRAKPVLRGPDGATETRDPTPPPAEDNRHSKEDAEFGNLSVNARIEARIFIDGKPTGQFTPLRAYRLPTGKHTLTLKTEDGQEKSRTIIVKPGRNYVEELFE